jgi:hypothetical protein
MFGETLAVGSFKIKNGSQEIEINKENASTYIEQISGLLEPGTPIMIKSYSHSDLPMTRRSSESAYLFLYGGEVTDNGKLTMQKGKRNYVYVSAHGRDEKKYDYDIIVEKNGVFVHGPSLPQLNRNEDVHKPCFSTAPPSVIRWLSGGGTSEILVGDQVKEDYPDLYNALLFGGDAIHFKLPTFYSRPGYLISNINKRKDPESKYYNIVAVTLLRNLFQETAKDKNFKTPVKFSKNIKEDRGIKTLQAWEVGEYREKAYRKEDNLPLDKEDFIIFELGHPNRTIAYVKPNKGLGVAGESFIYPSRSKAGQLVELALNPKNLEKYFPHRLND